VIDEPLAILAAMGWFTPSPRFSMFNRLHNDIDKHSPCQNGFEAYLAFYLRHVFVTAPALDEVFTFRYDFTQRSDLAWQHEEFELVTVVDLANAPHVSVLTPSSGAFPNLGLLTEEDDQVSAWISTNSERFTFCFPPESFGPDLLCFVQSKTSGKILLVVIEAKNYNKVQKQDLFEGVRTVTPSWFWKSKAQKVCPFLETVFICFD
jgi:hypothetical protein